jgi:Tol biopolymer transport system component
MDIAPQRDIGRVWRALLSVASRVLGHTRWHSPGAGDQRLCPSQVYAVSLSSGRPVLDTLVRLTPEGEFAQSAISPDGRRVACWGEREGVPGYQLYCTDLSTHQCKQLTHGPGLNGHPAWTPDSRSLVYFSSCGVSETWRWRREDQFQTDRTPTNLFYLDLLDQARHQLTFGHWVDERPAVSPDGKTIVFVSNRSGSMNLWTLVRGAEPNQLTSNSKLDYRPQFSPDGSKIAYFTENPSNGRHELAIVSWPETERVPVSPTCKFDWVHGPYWSPAGDALLLHALRHGESRPYLWCMDLSTGECERLSIEGVPDCSHGTWDAERRWLVFDTRSDLCLPAAMLS